jgi:uncharacterized protein with GYD domain
MQPTLDMLDSIPCSGQNTRSLPCPHIAVPCLRHIPTQEKGDRMPLYIAMTNWTDQGVKNLKESPNRAEAFKKMATEMGCTVHGLFFTMGRYDIAARIEAPDDDTMSALALKLGALGNVRTETMRAYTEAEFAQIMKKVTG